MSSTNAKGHAKQRLWRGLTALTAVFLAFSLVATTLVNQFRTNLDSFLGTVSSRVVTEEADPSQLYTFTSEFTSTAQLLQAIATWGSA